jgi:putative heme-binding domain-containing protein
MHEGRGDPERGRLVFEKNCQQCHRFEGKGHEVGPNLDGAERSIDYLLTNILDPNRVIGQPYYQRIILTKPGKLLTGLVAAEDAQAITLKRENNVHEVIQKDQIENMKTEEKSLMPEGLGNNITPPEFRDLVRYMMANPFLTDVHVSEPVSADHPIGKELTVSGGNPLTLGGVKWSTPEIGPAGRIPLQVAKANANGKPVQYVHAEIATPAAVKTRLLMGANTEVTIWLNGQQVHDAAKPGKEAQPDQHAVEVSLRAGVNHLVFRASCQAESPAFHARFVDPDRKLSYSLPKR